MRVETLDTWDQILQIAVRGCDTYPAGYDFTDRRGKGLSDDINLRCDNPNALGWLGALLMLVIVILGSFVLPTVLIGIVAISFEEAIQKAARRIEMMASMNDLMEQVQARLPGYFTDKKCSNSRKYSTKLMLMVNFLSILTVRGKWNYEKKFKSFASSISLIAFFYDV